MADPRKYEATFRTLVVDDEENIRVTLSSCLESQGHRVVAHGTIQEALAEISRQAFDLIFLDARLGVDSGLDFLPRLRAESPLAKVIVMTAYASVASAAEAMKLGAADYLPKPFTPAQVKLVTQSVLERRLLEWRIEELQQALSSKDLEADFPTKNREMQQALDLARRVASSKANILISGETGTGKGRLARAIHAWSPCSAGPYATVHCDAADTDRLDIELFGMSLPDAVDGPADVAGKVAFCEGGTLVLEEVGALPPSLQPRLERLLLQKEYERHNDFKPRRANVRIIALTSVDLNEVVKRRRFRAELVLALDVVRVDVPPLRRRVDDIRMLAKRYLALFSRENHRVIAGFSPDALHALEQHPWPGNGRELRNLIERAVLLCQSDRIGLEHFSRSFGNTADALVIGDFMALETLEDLHMRRVYESTGSVKGAASILGIHETTMARWVKRYAKETPSAR